EADSGFQARPRREGHLVGRHRARPAPTARAVRQGELSTIWLLFHLSRLRGRDERSSLLGRIASKMRSGWGISSRRDSRCGSTPTPALPRKRERERGPDADALCDASSYLISILASLATFFQASMSRALMSRC